MNYVRLAALLAIGAVPSAVAQRQPGPFTVNASWLLLHLHDKDLAVLSVGSRSAYEKGHVPGSLPVGPEMLENMASSSLMDVAEVLPEAELHARLEKLGLSDGTQVVLVLTGTSVPTVTRAQFLILYAGLEHVAILDGGMNAWLTAGNPVSAEAPATPVRGRITRHVIRGLVVDAEFVRAHRASPHSWIVDARAASYFNGPSTKDLSGVNLGSGHIPGAVSIPFNTLLDNSLHFLPATVLEQRFRAVGIAPGDTIIGYCHFGMQATTVLLAARLLGYPVQLYTGSFHDWMDHSLPTEGGTP